MAGVSIQMDDAQVQELLSHMSGFELFQLAQIAGEELLKVSQDAFEEKKDPVTGQSWKPSQNEDTLYQTGDLFRSLAYDASSRGNLVEVGSQMIYARIHQLGGKAGRGKKVEIPQRRFLGMPPGFDKQLFNMPQTKKLLGV